jgi:Mrp family chromosome partitioning ATPase
MARRPDGRDDPSWESDDPGFAGRYTMVRRRVSQEDGARERAGRWPVAEGEVGLPPEAPQAAPPPAPPATVAEQELLRQQMLAQQSAAPPPQVPAADLHSHPTYVPSVTPPVAPDAPEMRVIPHAIPDPPDPDLILLAENDTPRAASWRVLRHDLADHGGRRVFAVMSPHAGDGKTTAAANLALALSECGRGRVLLIEGNLAAPRLASLFGFTPPWCFSDQIAAHRQDPRHAWAVVSPVQPWLHVLAIRPDAPPATLLDTVAWSMAIGQLRRADYDFVVIDGPRVIGSADANVVQDSVDAVVLVTRRRRSRARDLKRAADQLGSSKLLGVVHLD